MSTPGTARDPAVNAVAVVGESRGAFLMRAVLGSAAAYGALSAAPLVRRALAQEEQSGERLDIEIMNFALTLEFLEAEYYELALDRVPDLSSEARELAELVGEHERQHVLGLRVNIRDFGGEPVKAPKVDFGDAFASEQSFLELAQTFEDTGVSAYNGAGPMISDKELLTTAGAIVQTEARHAAAIRFLAGSPPAPEAFDPALEMDEVLDRVEPFLRA